MTPCPRCGALLAEGAVACGHCGAEPLHPTPPALAPPAQPSTPSPGGPGSVGEAGRGAAAAARPPAREPQFLLWAVLSAVQAVLTCGVGLLFGALGVAFAMTGRSAWWRGERDRARFRLRVAKALALAGFGLAAALVFALVLFRISAGTGSVPSY